MCVFGGWEDTKFCARESLEQRFQVKPVGVAAQAYKGERANAWNFVGPPVSCQIQGGAGVYPRTARYGGEKQSASSSAVAPEGSIGSPTCNP